MNFANSLTSRTHKLNISTYLKEYIHEENRNFIDDCGGSFLRCGNGTGQSTSFVLQTGDPMLPAQARLLRAEACLLST